MKYFIVVNIIIGGFNLIPAYPMDGGRILRSLLSGMKEHKIRDISNSLSVGFAFLFLIVAIKLMAPTLGLLSLFLLFLVWAERNKVIKV